MIVTMCQSEMNLKFPLMELNRRKVGIKYERIKRNEKTGSY